MSVVTSQPGSDQAYDTKYGMDNQAMNMQPAQAGYGHGQAPQQQQAGFNYSGTQVVVPQGLPPSLNYLANLDEIKIEQILELAEVLVGWEKNNKYDICNNAGQKFLYAKEKTDCCMRQMCGQMRPFTMDVTDLQNIPVLRLVRPYRCVGSCMWCCFMQEMQIESPPGQLQATIKQIWTMCQPKYKVYSNTGEVLLSIVGDVCYCKCCTDVVFQVYEGDIDAGGQEIGKILKHWSGCAEMCGAANRFSIKFPQSMDLMKKLILFGATFLIDFVYFEVKN